MATWADKWNNKKYIFWIALVLSFFIGFRHKSVGIDTNNYYNSFHALNSFSSANMYNDPGFYKVAYLLMKIKKDPYFPICVYSTISVFIMVYRLWDYRKTSSYNFAVLRYVSLFYFYEMNCMRQFFSMAIVFYGIKFLESREYNKFVIFVLIASYFHIAALTSLIYLALEKLRWKNLDRKQKNIINLMYIFSPLAIFYVLNTTGDRVNPYFNTTSAISNYLSYFLKVSLFIAFIVISQSEYEKEKRTENGLIEYSNRKMQFIYYFIGMTLTGFGFVWAQFERIGYFYYIFAPNYVGIVTKSKRYRALIIVIVLSIIIRAFYLSNITNSMGQMPFKFNWE